jgi:hypothetical protein
MLIKSADDKSKRLALLEDLQKSPLLDQWQKDKLKDMLWKLRRGMEGERDAAHYLNNHYAQSKTSALVHDLRIEVDGEVAQIDHLIMTRGFHFYMLETKTFGGNVVINDHGEFSVEYPGERIYGIESPIEQSRRQSNVLAKLLEKLEITGRLGNKPFFHHLVLVHPKAIITRPDPKRFDTTTVIKADQFASWHDRFVEKDLSVGEVFTGLANLRSAETVMEWGKKLVRQHRPAKLLVLPDFLAPKQAQPLAQPMAAPVKMPQAVVVPPPPKPEMLSPAPLTRKGTAVEANQDAPKYFCAKCKKSISQTVADFCFNRKPRFGGRAYCMDHQRDFS